MSNMIKIRFTQHYAGWPAGAYHTVTPAAAARLAQIGIAQIQDQEQAAAPDIPDEISEAGDLTQIRGIGAARQAALNAAGVYTLAELLRADVATLDANLDGSNARQILAWQAKARIILAGRPA